MRREDSVLFDDIICFRYLVHFWLTMKGNSMRIELYDLWVIWLWLCPKKWISPCFSIEQHKGSRSTISSFLLDTLKSFHCLWACRYGSTKVNSGKFLIKYGNKVKLTTLNFFSLTFFENTALALGGVALFYQLGCHGSKIFCSLLSYRDEWI